MLTAKNRADLFGCGARLRDHWRACRAWVAVSVRLFAKSNGSSLTTVHEDLRTMAIEWSVVAVLAVIALGAQRCAHEPSA